MTEIPVNKPEVKFGINRNIFSWPQHSLEVIADRITDDGKAELYFYHKNGDGTRLLHMGNANLLSSTMQREFLKALSTRGLDLDWQTILTYISRDTMEHLRQGEPVDIIAGQPNHPRLEYAVRPILEQGLPTTIYGAGASAKSYIADLIAVIVQFSRTLDLLHTTWTAQGGNVLYLDWESNKADHERRIWAIKQGLGLDDFDTDYTIFYRKCSQPLISDLPVIQQTVFDNEIVLVIIDSQMAASGYGPDQAQLASHYYNGLNSFSCTTLTIDHLSKDEWKGLSDSVAPYGSVVKYNRCRSLYEVQKKQYSGEHYIDIAMIHRKHNEGLLQLPIGMRLYFYQQEDDPDRVARVEFEWSDPENVMRQKDQDRDSKAPDMVEQISDLIQESGKSLSVKEISDGIKSNENSVKSILNRHKDSFTIDRKDGRINYWRLNV